MQTRIKPVSPEIAGVVVPAIVRIIASRVVAAERYARIAERSRSARRSASYRYDARAKLREVHALEVSIRRLGVDVLKAEGDFGARIARLDAALAKRAA